MFRLMSLLTKLKCPPKHFGVIGLSLRRVSRFEGLEIDGLGPESE